MRFDSEIGKIFHLYFIAKSKAFDIFIEKSNAFDFIKQNQRNY